MSSNLKKFEQSRKTNIANTIGGNLWLWVEELSRTVSGAKSASSSWKKIAKNQISRQTDKYENAIIKRRKNKI